MDLKEKIYRAILWANTCSESKQRHQNNADGRTSGFMVAFEQIFADAECHRVFFLMDKFLFQFNNKDRNNHLIFVADFDQVFVLWLLQSLQ